MNRYATSIPRSLIGIAAVVATASIFGLSVVVPAQLASGSQREFASAPLNSVTAAPVEVVISPASIDVIGTREQKTAHEPSRQAPPKHKQAS